MKLITLEGGEFETVGGLEYLGSLIASSGRMDVDVKQSVARASRAFTRLRKTVFLDKNLSLSSKWKIYNSCILSMLLYGGRVLVQGPQ